MRKKIWSGDETKIYPDSECRNHMGVAHSYCDKFLKVSELLSLLHNSIGHLSAVVKRFGLLLPFH